MKLFFRHQRAEEDILAKPEWESSYPKYSPLGALNMYEGDDCGVREGEEVRSTCPFALFFGSQLN